MSLKRGFFRLWVVLSAGWFLVVGVILTNTISNLSPLRVEFSYSEEEQLETLLFGQARREEVIEKYANGYYEKAHVPSLGEVATFYLPNRLDVLVDGRTYRMEYSTSDGGQPEIGEAREPLVSFILADDPDLARSDVEVAVDVALQNDLRLA